jgi:hypothetical protein
MTQRGRIRTCFPKDVQQIADLHARIFWAGESTTVGLRDYYERVLFEHPWRNDEFPSLVYEHADGSVRGFVGRMPRPVVLRGEPSWMVVVHRLMADRGVVPFLGVRLLEATFAGPQSLTLADWASNAGRKAWKRAGGQVQPVISLSWHKTLHPVRHKVFRALRNSALRPVMYGAWPLATALDALLDRDSRKEPPPAPMLLEESELGEGELLAALELATSRALIKPVYDPDALHWMFDFLAAHPAHGRFEARKLSDARGRLIGWFLQYCKDREIDVFQLGATDGDLGPVLRHVIRRAKARGILAVRGRAEPRTFEALAAERCHFTAGYAWALVHSRDPDVLNLIQEPATFLTSLEGERWLCNVDERL